MTRILLAIATLLLLSGCAGSPYRIGIEAEQNRANLLSLNVDMTKDQVLSIMGEPYTTEMYSVNGDAVEFWLYITQGNSVDNRRLADSNFTPLSFENGILKGWGRNYYNNALRIEENITIEQRD